MADELSIGGRLIGGLVRQGESGWGHWVKGDTSLQCTVHWSGDSGHGAEIVNVHLLQVVTKHSKWRMCEVGRTRSKVEVLSPKSQIQIFRGVTIPNWDHWDH